MLSLRNQKTYFHIIYYHFLTILAYPYELIITVIEPAIEVGLLALFWSMIAKEANQHIDLANMVGYFLMVQFVSIWALNPGGLNFSSYLGYRIKSGLLSYNLIRPFRILPSLLSEHRGYYLVDMIFSVVLFILSIKLIGGITLAKLGWFIIFLGLSFITTFSLCVIIASLAFITKEINGIRHSVSHLVRIFSGAMVPLTLFPEKIREILLLTPFPYMVFCPINILQNNLPINTLLQNLGVSVVWALILFSAALFIWHHSMKKYEAIGI